MLAGQETPDAGSLTIGETVQLAYVDQSRADLDPANNVWKEISGGHDIIELGKKELNSRQYVSQFNFRGTDQQKRVGDLSGGERNRVHLAKLLRSGGNVLLLDEPTNDLDVDTLRALEEALLDFAGCAVVITHDRWFLDRVATHILSFEGDSRAVWFEGTWAVAADAHSTAASVYRVDEPRAGRGLRRVAGPRGRPAPRSDRLDATRHRAGLAGRQVPPPVRRGPHARRGRDVDPRAADA